jgi:hypothetical protein
MPEVRRARHCRHCLLGGCPGACLHEDGSCIHSPNGRYLTGYGWRIVFSRRWWHQVLWGN